jgi:hypothetical protein
MHDKKPLRSLLVLGIVLLTSSVASAQNNGYIGVFSDPSGSTCCIDATGGVTTLHVLFVTAGATSAGITGAEFRIDVTPPDASAFYIWSSSPAASVTLGDPVNNVTPNSLNMAFAECQSITGFAGDHIPLGTITVINVTQETELAVKAHLNPTNSNFACALVNLCDGPAFSQVCLTLQEGDEQLGGQEPVGFRSYLNSPTCEGASCGIVAVESASWTGVKSLFR